MFNGLAICAGGGGLEAGLHIVFSGEYRTICAVERQAYAAACLVSWLEKTPMGACPVWDDVTTFDPLPWRGLVDILSMGLPCQPHSCAGKKLGKDDPRYLWPHGIRLVRQIKPWLVFGENVGGFAADGGLAQISADLEEAGYRVAAGIFSAEETGAPHLRERLFFLGQLADTESLRWAKGRPEYERQQGRISLALSGSEEKSLPHPSRGAIQAGQESAGRPPGADIAWSGTGATIGHRP